jgi:hypothetical protein
MAISGIAFTMYPVTDMARRISVVRDPDGNSIWLHQRKAA